MLERFASIGSFVGLFRMDMNLNVAWELNWCFIIVVCSLDLVFLVLFCTPFFVSCTKSWRLNMGRIRVLKGA